MLTFIFSHAIPVIKGLQEALSGNVRLQRRDENNSLIGVFVHGACF